jgi:hypothetical protein
MDGEEFTRRSKNFLTNWSLPPRFVVKGLNKKALLETYHGAYISVNYFITAKVERGVMKRGLEKGVRAAGGGRRQTILSVVVMGAINFPSC